MCTNATQQAKVNVILFSLAACLSLQDMKNSLKTENAFYWKQSRIMMLSDFLAWSFRVRTIVPNNKHFVNLISGFMVDLVMEPGSRKDKPKQRDTSTRGDRGKQKSAQQELKQRQRAEVGFYLCHYHL